MIREIAGLPHRFERPELLEKALTHRSLGRYNNERLEFLGDSILGTIVSARLFELRPGATEGDLTRLRARVVRGDTLARIAGDLDLGRHLNLGEGELKSGGHRRGSILADALEAVFAAVYLDGGFEAAERVIRHLCDPIIEGLPDAEALKDPKTRLQEALQGGGRPLPEYDLLGASGADHAKTFTVRCTLPHNGACFDATGGSRRKAEQAAARMALESLEAS